MTSVWSDQQSFYMVDFHTIILPFFSYVYQISIHFFVIELQYELYDTKLYTVLLMKPNSEVVMNVNRLA